MTNELTACRNCGFMFSGNYCNQCGEKRFTEHDRSMRHLLEEAAHFITHFDGKFLSTVKTMVLKPGQYSLDYVHGIRRKYFSPVSFFLLLVVIYLLFPIAPGLNQNISYHVRGSWYAPYAMREALAVMRSHHYTDMAISETFHHISEKVSKFLLFLIIIFMAFASKLFAGKRKKQYYDHFVFSTELTSFFILLGFLMLPLITRLAYRFLDLFVADNEIPDLVMLFVLAIGSFIYFFIAAKRFFQYSTGKALVYTAAYVLLMIAFIQYVYKFILFWITISLMK